MNLFRERKIKPLKLSGILICLFAAVSTANAETPVTSVHQIGDKTIAEVTRKHSMQERKNIFDAEATKDAMKLEQDIKFFPEEKIINIMLKEVDVPSILRILAREGKRNIVIDPSVVGTMSAELKGVSLNEAMQVILTSEELEARLSNSTIFVASRPVMAKKGLNRRIIKAFKLNNSNPVEVAQILDASIFNRGYKITDPSAVGAGATGATVAGSSMNATIVGSSPTTDTSTTTTTAESAGASSTGQSIISDAKIIKGKVEELAPGENFGDANKLASTIKIQQKNSSTKPIQVNNNDGGAIVIPDTRTNSIIVAGIEQDILLVEEALKTIDKALRQVSIEVSLIELKKDDRSDLGLNLNTQGGSLTGGFNSVNGVSGYPTYEFISDANFSGITLNSLQSLQKDFYARLNALITDKKAKLLANPRILALDDSESLIKITDQVVSKVTTTITQTSITYNADIADVGIVLNILPKIGDDDHITMRVRPSITNPLPEISIGNFTIGGLAAAAIRVTPISTREVILQDVRVKSGETLAIAGLTKENNVEDIAKIPIAGDIPVVGKLFRNKTYTHNKTELIILITPVIVGETPAEISSK